MKSKTHIIIILFLLLFGSVAQAQTGIFYRSAVIPVPENQPGGYGNIVSGVDLDNDGMKEIYAVNDNWGDTPAEMIPMIYKYENHNGTWEMVWSASLDVPQQNTWPALTTGDWDNDGKQEVIWGPVNFNDATVNPNPARIVVFEVKGDGSDVLGVDDGNGNYLPNAKWTITDQNMTEVRPIKWELYDIDSDGTDELIFADRNGGGGYLFGVVSVDNIPDNGDSSETWTLEASGLTVPLGNTNSKWDYVILGNIIYLFNSTMTVAPVKYDNGVFTALPSYSVFGTSIYSFKSAQVVDIDGDQTEEALVASYTAAQPKVFVLQQQGDSLVGTEIASITSIPGSQFVGGAAGDIDQDGKVDYVFGTRNGSPNAIFRVEYQGGSITDPASYTTSAIDQGLFATGGQFDALSIANVDDDPFEEVIYTGIPRDSAPIPIVVLDYLEVQNLMSIKEARVDANGDFVPDLNGQTVTVVGYVNSINFTASANRFTYTIQDDSAGISITKGSEPGGGTVYNVGDQLLVSGTLGHFNGTTQISISDLTTGVTQLGSGLVQPITLTLADYLASPETYESRLVRIGNLSKSAASPAWPASGSNANMLFNHSGNEFIVRIDADADLDENVEPGYPATFVGIGTQYTTATPPNNGYQVSPRYYFQDIIAPPSPHFALLTPADGAELEIVTGEESWVASWSKPVDADGDNLLYQFVILPNTSLGFPADTTYTLTAATVLGLMGTEDSLEVGWTVRAKGDEPQVIACVDTSYILFINKIAGPEALAYLEHTPGDLSAAIYNDGAIGADRDASGPGISWKGQNGLYTGGLVFGTTSASTVNGLIPSFVQVTNNFITDINNVASDFAGGFMSDADFDQIAMTKLNDAGAAAPYGLDILQYSYSKTGDNFVYLRYGYINTTANPITDFYAGLIIDWDIDANTYASNKGGYSPDEHMAYMFDQTSPYYYGLAAINGMTGSRVSNFYPGSEAEGRSTAFGYISGTDFTPITTGRDYRMYMGTKTDDIQPGDTTWVTFAIVAGDDLNAIRTNANAAFQKANNLGWTDITVGVENEKEAVPQTFYVDQNYPNPFNPSTTIQFGVPSEMSVDVRIYDMLGQEIAVLVNNQTMNAGVYRYNFDASSLASGTYIYRIQAGSNVSVKKMLLIK